MGGLDPIELQVLTGALRLAELASLSLIHI